MTVETMRSCPGFGGKPHVSIYLRLEKRFGVYPTGSSVFVIGSLPQESSLLYTPLLIPQ